MRAIPTIITYIPIKSQLCYAVNVNYHPIVCFHSLYRGRFLIILADMITNRADEGFIYRSCD